MFVVTVRFEINPDHLDAFHDVIRAQAKNSLEREEACHQFDVCFDPNSPATCFLYEKYDTARSFDEHRETDHFKQFNAEVTPWVVSKEVRTWNQQT